MISNISCSCSKQNQRGSHGVLPHGGKRGLPQRPTHTLNWRCFHYLDKGQGFYSLSTFKVKASFQTVEFAERAEILLLAFNACSLCEVTPARNHLVDCLGTNSLLLLFLHYAKWEFQMGVSLFHSFTVPLFN